MGEGIKVKHMKEVKDSVNKKEEDVIEKGAEKLAEAVVATGAKAREKKKKKAKKHPRDRLNRIGLIDESCTHKVSILDQR